MNIVSSAVRAFLLREQPFSHFAFPRWQTWAVVLLIGLLAGLDPRNRMPPPEMPDAPVMPLWAALVLALAFTWLSLLLTRWVMGWWLRRGGRWDGQGDLLNLIAAAWLVPSVLTMVLNLLGVDPLFSLPLLLFSGWVMANAISGAVPRASMGYTIAGMLISTVPLMLMMVAVGMVLGVVVVMMAGGPVVQP